MQGSDAAGRVMFWITIDAAATAAVWMIYRTARVIIAGAAGLLTVLSIYRQ